MKCMKLVLSLGAAVMLNIAQAETVSVATLSEIRDAGGLVQLIAVNGECQYFGAVDLQANMIRVDRKACLTEEGGLIHERYMAQASFGMLPVAANTHLTVERVCAETDQSGAISVHPCASGRPSKNSEVEQGAREHVMHENQLPPAYIRVRNELAVKGYDAPMRSRQEIRAILQSMQNQAEELARRQRELLSELDEADQQESSAN
ncbi:hypothetical protein RBE51_20455 [Pseudomonas taiwanensis]|uniref:hypothetical protein n=1 Tax=Pseudomonas taiwanensis TaxID=470150 RepID=UPI0028DF9ABE|nr:hypothetical protein [Pseudomonas taiwanensis]MDT8925167.1 hypothetical protein [Pseudomonas taiwanensis]